MGDTTASEAVVHSIARIAATSAMPPIRVTTAYLTPLKWVKIVPGCMIHALIDSQPGRFCQPSCILKIQLSCSDSSDNATLQPHEGSAGKKLPKRMRRSPVSRMTLSISPLSRIRCLPCSRSYCHLPKGNDHSAVYQLQCREKCQKKIVAKIERTVRAMERHRPLHVHSCFRDGKLRCGVRYESRSGKY